MTKKREQTKEEKNIETIFHYTKLSLIPALDDKELSNKQCTFLTQIVKEETLSGEYENLQGLYSFGIMERLEEQEKIKGINFKKFRANIGELNEILHMIKEPDNMIYSEVLEANEKSGVDIGEIADSMNFVENMYLKTELSND